MSEERSAPSGRAHLAPGRIAALRRELLAWYERARRDLPWRRTRDPYRIWLSETMLQQTRVDTVIPYYERFLDRFPDVTALADAEEDDVLREWAGLGYYSRARNLHRAAQQVVRDHGAELPSDPDALRALPGVGAYTLGALQSIAFDRPAPIVDGNVRRVLARWLAAAELDPREEWSLAAALVPPKRPGDFNQALMELGATVCTPRAPQCGFCPVAGHCDASERDPERYPAPRRRAPVREIQAVAGLLERGRSARHVLLSRRPRRGLLGSLWELPSCEGSEPAALVPALEEASGLRVRVVEPLGSLEHGFTHRRLTLHLVRLALLEPRRFGVRSAPDRELRWFARAELLDIAHSRLMRKTLALAGVSSDV